LWSSKRAFYNDHIEEKQVKDWKTKKFLRNEKVKYKNLKMLREKIEPFTFFYFPPAPLHFIQHSTELVDYTEYDKICMGVITEEDLEKNWAVVAEAIQTILRREGYPNPYEALKDLTRTNTIINKEAIHNFIQTLKVSDEIKVELMQISPSNYLGI
jgi:hypothetical protein